MRIIFCGGGGGFGNGWGALLHGDLDKQESYGGVTIRFNVFFFECLSLLRVRQKVDPGALEKRLVPFSQPFLQRRSLKTELRQATSASRTPPRLPSGWGCRGRLLTLRCALLGRRAGITEQYNVGVIVHPKNAELLAVRGELKLSGRVCQEVRNLPA